MLTNGFTFNSVRKDYVLTLAKKREYWAPIRRNFSTITGRPGAFLASTETDIRTIEIDVMVSAESAEDLRKVSEDFADWLLIDEPAELIFDDEEDRVYYAVVDGTFSPEEIVAHGYGTITFVCPDPYKYGPELKTEFTDTSTFNVSGTIETLPVIAVELKSDVTFVAIGNGDKINMVGRPADVDQTPIVREERKLWHQMDTLSGWSDTAAVEEGVITGTLKTTGYSFYSDTYGANASWHGPAKKISIGSSVQDFQVDALVHQSGAKGQSGSLEIALLDANNNFVAKMVLTKRSPNNPANWARLRAGSISNGYDIMNTRGATDNTWANFDGMLRISRVGNIWNAYVCLIDSNGVQHTRAGGTWVDSTNIATAPITQVQVQLWQYGTTPTTQQYVADLKVYKINSVTDTQVPVIATAGDVIEFDHQNDIIRKNGEDVTKEKAFIGEYFALNKGMNTIVVEPSDAINSSEVRWRPRWR